MNASLKKQQSEFFSKMTNNISNTNTNKVVKGLSTQTIITITLGVLEILSFSIMSRLLTEKDFGYYAAILAVVTVFQSFAESGVGSAIIQRKIVDKHYLDSSFSMNLIIGIIVSSTLFFSAGIVADLVADNTMKVPLRIISITLLFNCLTSVNISILQRKLQFVKIGLINIISLTITTIVAIILASKGYGYYAILTKGVLTSLLTLTLSFFIAGQKYRFVFDISTYKQIFGFGGWLTAAAIFRNVASQVDRLLMSSLFSVQTLGFYTRPKEFINTVAAKCNTIFDTVLFPVLSSLQDNKNSLQRSFKKSCYSLNLFAMLMGILFFCNSELLIRIFFGEKWMNVNTLFKVLSIYPVLLINGRMGDIFLRSLALTKQQFFFRVGQLLFAITFILVGYNFGIVAVAISVMASYACITAIKISYVTNKMQISKVLVIRTMIESYRFVLFIIPFYILSYFLLPNTWTGNIIQSIIIIIILGTLFLAKPNLVGSQYKDFGYSLFVNLIKTKIIKKNDRSKGFTSQIQS